MKILFSTYFRGLQNLGSIHKTRCMCVIFQISVINFVNVLKLKPAPVQMNNIEYC